MCCAVALAVGHETQVSTGTHAMAGEFVSRHRQGAVAAHDDLEAVACACRRVRHDHQRSERGITEGLGRGYLEGEATRRATSRSWIASAAKIALAGAADSGGAGTVAGTKVYRRASEQFNIRATPEDAALIRAAFPPRTITQVAVELLVAEAKARLRNQPELVDTSERRTEAA
jgi:hypothetical protein